MCKEKKEKSKMVKSGLIVVGWPLVVGCLPPGQLLLKGGSGLL